MSSKKPKTTYFQRLHNLTVTLTVCVYGVKRGIHNWAGALKTTRAILYRLKMS